VRSDALVVAVDGGLVVHFNHVGLNKSQGSSLIELQFEGGRGNEGQTCIEIHVKAGTSQ